MKNAFLLVAGIEPGRMWIIGTARKIIAVELIAATLIRVYELITTSHLMIGYLAKLYSISRLQIELLSQGSCGLELCIAQRKSDFTRFHTRWI